MNPKSIRRCCGRKICSCIGPILFGSLLNPNLNASNKSSKEDCSLSSENFANSVSKKSGNASDDRNDVKGIEPYKEYMYQSVTQSLMLVTALKSNIGYDKSFQIAKKTYKDGTSLREATIALGYLSGEEFDLLVQPQNMAYPEDCLDK